MDKRELKIDYFIYRDSYPEGYAGLCKKALEASEKAYCVYSDFAVGAAVLLADGTIVTGYNQENAAFPSGLCAERTALFYAGANYPQVPVKALAVVAGYKGQIREKYVTPCGACRQVMSEVIKRYGKDFEVILIGQKENLVIKASALLPLAFDF